MSRGFFAIGIENPKKEHNIGTLWRSVFAFGASFIFTVGPRRYEKQSSDVLCSWRHIPLWHFANLQEFQSARPFDTELVGVEYLQHAPILRKVGHPARAIYLLGAEDHGLSKQALAICQRLIRIPAAYCLNVATAGRIVMYDRCAKADRTFAKEEAAQHSRVRNTQEADHGA